MMIFGKLTKLCGVCVIVAGLFSRQRKLRKMITSWTVLSAMRRHSHKYIGACFQLLPEITAELVDAYAINTISEVCYGLCSNALLPF